MRDKSSLYLLLAGGALGSCGTLALLKLLSRARSSRSRTERAFPDGYHGQNAESVNATSSLKISRENEVINCKIPYKELLEDEIVHEHLTRNIQFFGIESQQKITGAFVVVIGLGGVGSHAAAMLLRSGVGRLRIVDFDQVSLSSLNRHAVATREDVGSSKAHCLKKHFQTIFPEVQIEARAQLYDKTSEDEILGSDPDLILDCIDNIDTKVSLLAACVRRKLKVISATGAGARADPTRIRIADLQESSIDPLSRVVRHRLRREHGIESGIKVVFSLEKPKAKLLPFEGKNGEENPSDYQIVPGFRVRVIPVLGTIPAIFGQVMASFVLTQLAEVAVHTEPIVNFDPEHYSLLFQRLIEREEVMYGTAEDVLVDIEEIVYIVKELWRGRSAQDQHSHDNGRGMWRSINNLTLTRWDRSKPACVTNLILLKFSEADEHEKLSVEEIKAQDSEYYDMVINVLKQAAIAFGEKIEI